jgi:flagellar motor protein MotB
MLPVVDKSRRVAADLPHNGSSWRMAYSENRSLLSSTFVLIDMRSNHEATSQ